MNRCVIVGAAPFQNAAALKNRLREGDFLIAADGGIRLLREMGVQPHFLVSDFDSSLPDKDSRALPQQVLPTHKDDTDMLAAVKLGLSRGFTDFLLLGGIGGRVDHTLANVMLLYYLLQHGAQGTLADEWQEICLLAAGEHRVPPCAGWHLSLLPYGGEVRGVTLEGVEYPLENAVFDLSHPLGVSNEFLQNEARIAFSEGFLLMIFAKDPENPITHC